MPVFEPEEERVPAPAVEEPPAVALEPGFRNPLAVRIGLMVATLSFIATAFSGSIVALPLVWLLAAGFISVYLYTRRTGLPLTLRSGARMGWMTGLFAFILLLVLLTTLVLALSDQSTASKLLAEMKSRGAAVDAEQMVQALQDPSGILVIVLVSFLVFTLFPMIGGLLGAKFLSGRTRP